MRGRPKEEIDIVIPKPKQERGEEPEAIIGSIDFSIRESEDGENYVLTIYSNVEDEEDDE